MKTEVIKIDPQDIDLEEIKRAAEVIKAGGLVAFPTETVYGLGADFFNKQAVERIFKVKKRAQTKPLTVQIQDITWLEKLGCDCPAFAYQWMSKFWPGPLTLVLRAKEDSPPLHNAGGTGRTIGVRIPDNKVAQCLIKMSETALVVPSANLSGEPPAKGAPEVIQTFDGLIEVVIDAGAVEPGEASTVVDLTVSPFKILREGTICRKDIQGVQG